MNPILIALDLETTGFDVAKDRIIEIYMKNLTIKTELEMFVYPCCKIPAEATAVNKITDVMVEKCKTFKEIVPELLNFLHATATATSITTNTTTATSTTTSTSTITATSTAVVKYTINPNLVLIGHNIKVYDLPLLEHEFQRAGILIDFSKTKVHDTLLIHRALTKPSKLGALHQFYCKAPMVESHRAKADVIATMAIHEAMKLYDGFETSSEESQKTSAAGMSWSRERQNELENLFKKNPSVPEIANKLGRTEGAIISQLKKQKLFQTKVLNMGDYKIKYKA